MKCPQGANLSCSILDIIKDWEKRIEVMISRESVEKLQTDNFGYLPIQ
jgi:hypothetical protein